MTRRLLALAATAALTVAAPAQAAIYPVCATSLAEAGYGTSNTCTAGNSPQVSGATVFRVLDVQVVTGAVRATITCGYGTYQHTASKVLYPSASRQFVRTIEDEGQTCRNTLESLATTGTTATAVSTWTYQFIGPVA